MSKRNIDHGSAKVKPVASTRRKKSSHSSRRPVRHARRRAKILAQRTARRCARRCAPPRSVLQKMLGPLRAAVAQAIDEKQERSWFPVLSVLSMLLCGLQFHLFGLSSMRATVEKANRLPALGSGKVALSTFSDAMNSPLRLSVLRLVFQNLLTRFADDLPRQLSKFRHLAAIDSTILHCAPKQLWAQYRKAVNAVKAHVTFDISNGIPTQFVLSAGKVHDRNYFEVFLKKGWTYVVDRAYNVYSLFDDMMDLEIFFVTRMKCNAAYRVVEEKRVKRKHRKLGVVTDQIIRLGSGATEMVNNLRLVVFRTEEGEILEFITNRFDLAPTSIAALYRARWAIELFFRFLKRTLRGVRLLARSEVGAEIHVLLALITDVLLRCLAKTLKCWRKARRHVPVTFMRLARELLLMRWTRHLEAQLSSTLL